MPERAAGRDYPDLSVKDAPGLLTDLLARVLERALQQRLPCRRQRPGVSKGGDGGPQQAVAARPRESRRPHRAGECTAAEGEKPLDERQERDKQGAGVVGIGIDRADLLAHVAAEDPVAKSGRLPCAQDAGMLDGEIADASPRIDRLRRDERPRRTAAEASPRRAA